MSVNSPVQRFLWLIGQAQHSFLKISYIFSLVSGIAIPRMILGALLDTKQISTCKLDVKPDVHVCTILYRLLYGVEKIVADANMVKEVIDITRQMHPENPWVLDDPLFDLGRRICKAKNPNCPNCPLIDICAFHYGVHLKIKKEQRDLPKVFARNHGAK